MWWEGESRVGPDLCGVGWIGFGGEVETMGEKCKWKVVWKFWMLANVYCMRACDW